MVFVAATGLRAAEETALTIREKLRAKLLASVPPPPPPSTAVSDKDKAETEPTPIVMKPVVVSESKSVQAITAALDRAEQERREERFSAVNGGTIGKIAGFEIGGWWSADGGWTFLRKNKAPTQRQADATKERIKELQDLSKIGQGAGR